MSRTQQSRERDESASVSDDDDDDLSRYRKVEAVENKVLRERL